MGVTVPARGLSRCVNSQKPRGSLGEVCVRDLSNESQEMMSLPGNRTQQNPEPRNPGLQGREKTPARSLAAKMFCCSPLPRGRGLRRAHRQSVWDRCRRWLRAPLGGLWPFARRNRKVTREPQAGPGHLSHPTRATLSSFPVGVDGVSGGVPASSKPRQMWGQKPVGW